MLTRNVGPRNRAPLGMKTTNAKGQLLKTPAPKESAQKTVSPRMRRAKVKILHEGAGKAAEELAEPDIEYMPPRSVRKFYSNLALYADAASLTLP